MQDSYYQLRVQLSAKGKRVVRPYAEHGRNPYGYGWRRNGELMQNFRNKQYYDVKPLWFRITIPYGRNYNKAWLLNSIANECGFQFPAIQFHYVNHVAAFFVDNFQMARSLSRASRKIPGERYHKIIINVMPIHPLCDQMRGTRPVDTNCPSPLMAMNFLDRSPAYIQVCLQKRYNRSLETLDLSNLSNDPGLRSANIFLCFSNSSATELILRIISEYFHQLLSLNLSHNKLSRLSGFAHLFILTPQLQSLNLSYNQICQTQELGRIHNLALRELWLEGNPLYEFAESSSEYYRLINYHFPTIQKLDGVHFKHDVCCDQEEPKPLPSPKGSYFICDEIKAFLMKFLHQYFTIYDSGERQALLPLYHEKACCSFSLPGVFFPKYCFDQITDYWKENRNLLKVKRPGMRLHYLKYNRLQVVGLLCNLPRTEHDLQSMNVDVSLQTTSLMCFVVEGRFREVNMNCKKPYIPFWRTFVITPSSDTCAQILNDQMVINNLHVDLQETSSLQPPKPLLAPLEAPPSPASSDDTISTVVSEYTGNAEILNDQMVINNSRVALQETSSLPPSNPLLAPLETLPPPAASDDTISTFSEYTGMKTIWALKCLEDNNWDVEEAKKIFDILKERGDIPLEAFTGEEQTPDLSG
ncbi:nuclear RNA export factor 1-like isoform X2 [Pseudophryne corroboree]|uniref:nuclear RNA export factor 1-like isoform X2 n=1 Tax=Pseudophryne corroboree TaxID=495146 RepID=UPI0030814DB2